MALLPEEATELAEGALRGGRGWKAEGEGEEEVMIL